MTTLAALMTAAVLATLPSTTPRTDLVADGVQTVFNFNFRVASSGDVKVYGKADGAAYWTEYVIGASVALTPKGPGDTMHPGGTVTFTVPPVPGLVRLERSVLISQDSLWTPYSAFKAKTLEGVLDKLVAHDQQLDLKASDLGTKDTALQAEIDAEEAARAAADAAEAAARTSSEASAASDRSSIRSEFAAADSAIRQDLVAGDAAAQGFASSLVNGVLAGTGAVPQEWSATANGTATRFSVAGAELGAEGMYVVTVGGVTQVPVTDYSLDLATDEIVFSSAPPAGVAVSVRAFGYARALTEADTALVTSTGGTTARALKDWTADVVGAKEQRARFAAQEMPRRVDVSLAKAVAAPSPLSTPVPYFGDEMVHPDVYFNTAGWNGYRYWMAVTPYEGTDSQYENPSIYVSQDGQTWSTPPGVTNPIIASPEGPAYNSDPDLVDGLDGRLYLFFRERLDTANKLWVTSSSDGFVTHSTPTLIIESTDAQDGIVSPGVVFDGKTWTMFYVDIGASPKVVRKRTAPRATGPWSAASLVTLPAAPGGKEYWHLDALSFGGRVLLLLDVADTNGNGSGGDLYFAWSDDGGAAFARASSPVVARTTPGYAPTWSSSSIYRGTFLPFSDGYETKLAIWYSAHHFSGGWHLGYTEAVLGPPAIAAAPDAAPLMPRTVAQTLSDVTNVYKRQEWEVVRAMTGAAPGAADTFMRADAATLGTAPTGQAWTTTAIGITGRLAYRPTSGSMATVDTGLADGRAGLHVANAGTGAEQTWLVFRYVDSSNFWRFGGSKDQGMRLVKIGGDNLSLPMNALAFVSPMSNDWWEVELSGSTIKIYQNGRLHRTVTDSFNSTATKHGLQIDNVTSRVSAFYMTGNTTINP